MPFKFRIIGAMLAVASVAACDYVNTAPRVADIKIVPTRFETRVLFLERCPGERDLSPGSSPPIAAMGVVAVAALTAAVPIVADLVAGAIGSYIKSRQDALAGNHYGTASAQLYTPQGLPAFQCLVVARGDFGPSLSSTVGNQQRGSLNADALKDAGLADFPDFYFDAKVSFQGQVSGETTVMTLAPNRLQLAKTVAGRTAHDAKTVNMLLLMSQAPLDPKTPDKSKASAVVPMQFEKVKIGTEIPPSLMAGRSVNIPVAGTAVPKSTLKNPGAFNMLILVEETEKPSAFEELVVATYTNHQKDVSAQIVAILKEALGLK